ncbi:MAG: molybdenum cofactor guanylyltransferase, partial [Planctomycetota bacterium]
MAVPPGRDEGRIATIAAALLVGGASSRMGCDKSRLELGGVANATRLALLLDAIFEDLLLVGGDPPAEAPGRRVADPEGPVCALRGLVAALEAARAPRVLVVATDLPLLTPDLVLALVAWPEADAVVPLDARGIHPLCAIYRCAALLPPARECLAAGRLELRGPLDAVATSYFGPDELARIDPGGRALT